MTTPTERRARARATTTADASGVLALPWPSMTARRPVRLGLALGDAASSGIVDVAELCHGFSPGVSDAVAVAASPAPSVIAEAAASDGRRQDRLAWAIAGIAALGVAALVGVVVTQPAATIVVQRLAPAPTMAVASPVDDEDEAVTSSPAVEDDATREVDARSGTADDLSADTARPSAEDDAAAQDDAQAGSRPKTAKRPKTASGSTSSAGSKPASTSKPATGSKASTGSKTSASSKTGAGPKTSSGSTEPSSRPAASGSTDAMPTADCILDPTRCGDTGGARPAPTGPKPTPAPASPAEDLPDKLSTHALRQGLAAAKPAAKQCGPRLGAAPGTKIAIKLSIAGATGRVVSATPQGAEAGTALGRCVANALSEAEFPRFSAQRQGVVYPVLL
jgi:hypothetical protein